MPDPSRIIAAALLAALATAGPAASQPAARPDAPRSSPARMFAQADSDGDGRVTAEEGWAWLSDRIRLVDINRDGSLSLEEWRGALPENDGPGAPARLGQELAASVFRGIDADRDGRLDPTEMRPFADAFFRAMDRDADGVLSAAELPSSPAPRRGRTPPRTREPAPETGGPKD